MFSVYTGQTTPWWRWQQFMCDVSRADPSSPRIIKREGDNFTSLQLEASSRVHSGFTFRKVGECDGFTVGGKPENISKYTHG